MDPISQTARLIPVLIALAAFGAGPSSVAHAQSVTPAPRVAPAAAGSQAAPAAATIDRPSQAALEVIGWVRRSRDNADQPYIVIDKVAAELFVFDAAGRPLARAPVLIGTATGDDSAPGIGNRELSRIPVAQRTTPTGRFPARLGPALGYNEKVLWVDHATAIALHPVIAANPRERRLSRLQSPTPKDNRITFGCINVGRKLYDGIIEPLFRQAGGVVYIMPETRPLGAVFAGLSEVPRARSAFDEAFASFRLAPAAQPGAGAR